jgi:putative flippase GtrA
VVCGGGVTLLASGALLLIGDRVPLALANAVLTVASTVLATELHGRFTFRRGGASWRDHAASGLTVLLSYLFTTGALLAYDGLHPGGGALLRQGVYLAASGLAGLARFLLLRHVVFAPGGVLGRARPAVRTPSAPSPATAPQVRPQPAPPARQRTAPQPRAAALAA